MLNEKHLYLGYKKANYVNENIINQIIPVLKDLNYFDITKNELSSLESISIKEIKAKALEFYNKYFNIHDVYHVELNQIKDNHFNIANSKDIFEAYKKYYSLFKEVSPFDIPIQIVDGHSMIGQIQKPLIIIPGYDLINKRKVPFSSIQLGTKLTTLSTATYIHEISHTQQESNIGYTDNYLNKEVISIFLEKIAALELDESLELLKKQERARFSHVFAEIIKLKTNLPDSDESSVYVYSALLAEKLFDNYLKERKQKNKDKYFYGIQDIFDGKIKIEEFLSNQDVSINKACNTEIIKKHIKA